jgi:hypothetical protein
MFNIQWMAPQALWLGLPALAVFGLGLAWYNLKVLGGARDLWGERVMLDQFSPTSPQQSRSLWGQWLGLIMCLVIALGGPNLSTLPEMVRAGAVQVQFVFDVSNSMAAEDYRPFLPAPAGQVMPSKVMQWGTRLDAAKYYLIRDFLPQLSTNSAGITTVEGVGYDLWDLTSDLSPGGAFYHMLSRAVKPGAAPGGGSDYTSGIKSSLDEFDLIDQIRAAKGDKSERVKFIVLFSDGGFTGDQAELDKVLDTLVQKKVRLVLVAMGGSKALTVPKYNPDTHLRTGEYFKGTTALDDTVFKHMRDRVPGTQIIYATPGVDHLHYDFPQQAGGLYAKPAQSNLRPWLLGLACLLFFSLTAGGGGWPRWKFLNPRSHLSSLWKMLRSLPFLANRPE